MNDCQTQAEWDKMAAAYEEFTAGEDSYSNRIEWPCIQKMLPALQDKDIIDLGCGSGRFTFLLEKEKPHTITGIDISPAMLKIAEKHKAALGSQAQFFQGDICRMATDHQYDLVFSSTVFHYIQELAPLFARIAALLKPHGQCIISQLHPVYTAQYPIAREGHFPDDEEWNVRYLDKNLRGYIQPWIEYNDDVSNFLSYSYHHTLSDYFQAITSSGLTITDMAEPMPPRDWQEKYPGRYEAFIETPSYLILKLQKA